MQICRVFLIFCVEKMIFSCMFKKNTLSLREIFNAITINCGNKQKYITMERKDYWQKLRKVLINKYAITLYLFALLLLFVGDNSLLQYVKRAKKMHALEQQLDATNQDIKEAESVMQMLDDIDSLERFAREEYRMHAPNEDVYVVK